MGWVVLNAEQFALCPHHPGSISMCGDLNVHSTLPNPPSSLTSMHGLPRLLRMQAKQTGRNPQAQASTAVYVKRLLTCICQDLKAKAAVIFEGAVHAYISVFANVAKVLLHVL